MCSSFKHGRRQEHPRYHLGFRLEHIRDVGNTLPTGRVSAFDNVKIITIRIEYIDVFTKDMKLAIICFAALLAGCAGNAQPVQNTANSTSEPQRAEKLQSVTAHTTENQTPRPADSNTNGSSKWSQSGNPIDTTKFDAAVTSAEKASKAKPGDSAAKTNLVEAYFDRGFALTEARQYASALGDYRRALKLDPNHAESKKWIEQIIGIYGMLKKDYPKEGEEPPPLPFKVS